MPRLTLDRVPKYRKHRASGQAIVTVDGRDVYLGPYNSVASKAEYDRVIAEWLANGRRLPQNTPTELLVLDILHRYRDFVRRYYVKEGQPTSEQLAIASAVRTVRRLYGRSPVGEFGPLALKAVREQYIQAGLARSTINAHVHRIRRMFKWAVENELVEAPIHQALLSVGGLRKGKSAARETAPIRPVADAVVEATLPYLSPVVADMVRFQRLTGCRPQDVCHLRPCDVDQSGEVWTYRPHTHKTEHHGRERTVFIGPRAQLVLRPYLLRDSEKYCFSPIESEQQRLARRNALRRTPLHYGNRPGTNRSTKRRRGPRDRYTTASYRRAVERAVTLANREIRRQNERHSHGELCQWHPNQLRHSAGTEVRARFGLEAAQVVLGHSCADVTQVYAERDKQVAIKAIMVLG